MSDAVTSVPRARLDDWRKSGLLLGGLGVLLLLAQWPLVQDLVGIWWRSKTFNHCFLIPVISAWLVHEAHRDVAQLTPRRSLAGVLLLAGASLLLLFGDLAGVALVSHFALVLSLQALAWAVLGTAVVRRLLFPLLYLWFAVPFGDFLVPKLQDITADMAVALLRLFDIPVFRDGHFIALPHGDFLVAEACSGISYLIASLALGTLYAYLQYRSYYRRAFFLVLSIVVPILANGVRAFGIILIAHLTDNEYAVGVDHLIYGWVFFGVVILLLFLLGRTFADGGPVFQAPVATSTAAQRPAPAWPVLLAAAALILAPALLGQRHSPAGAASFAVELPAPWQRQSTGSLGAELVGAREVLVWRAGEVEVLAGYFPVERQGSELVNSNHRWYDNDRWRPLQADQRQLAGVVANGMRLGSAWGDNQLVHGFYLFADRQYGPGWQVKWHQLRARLRQQPAPALYLLVLRPDSLPDAELEARLATLVPALQRGLARGSDAHD